MDCNFLTSSNKFVYLAAPRVGYNTLNIELDPAIESSFFRQQNIVHDDYNNNDYDYYETKLVTQVYFLQFPASDNIIGNNIINYGKQGSCISQRVAVPQSIPKE